MVGDFLKLDYLLPLTVIFLSVALDAVRDAWAKQDKGWWSWHLVKWGAFYPPLLYILYLAEVEYWRWPLIGIVAWVVWRLSARHIGGVKWRSWIFRGFKGE